MACLLSLKDGSENNARKVSIISAGKTFNHLLDTIKVTMQVTPVSKIRPSVGMPISILNSTHFYRPEFTQLRQKSAPTSSTTRSHRMTCNAVAAPTEAPVLPFRVGHGWDLHRLEPGYPLIIGGIDIPHDRGCVAHSDGDVLLHTVVDAILGALSLPDIGQLFPDNDPKWKGARSDIFLKEAVRLMQEHGYAIGNIDCTIIAQRPKLSPHKETIRENLCALLGAHPSVVNIKAKTHEKVDSLGENRSISCHAVVILLRQ